MVIIVPLVPIIIGILCIVFGLFGEFSSNIQTITNIVLIVNIIIFLCIAIYNVTREISSLRKYFSLVVVTILGTISGFIIKFFMDALGAIDFSIIGLIEFIFVGGLGGCIALLLILGCIQLSLKSGDW